MEVGLTMKVKRLITVLSTAVAELYSFMKCFGSCQFLRGLWMDISGEVANIHMRTDAKNEVNTARTIDLPEQKGTIHMIPMLRKEACAGSIHDLAHTPTPNCLTDCLTKASAEADNLITAVKTEELLDVDIHPVFRTLMNTRPSCLPGAEHLCTQGIRSFLPEHTQILSCTNSPRRTISSDVCGDSADKGAKGIEYT